MATYAIGDLQGCFSPLEQLLDEIGFDARRDRLWFVGDLVNRGKESLAALRFVKGLGEAAITVLGNHDLHLLCVAEGFAKAHRGDTLDEILAAPDRAELLEWVRWRPMMHLEYGYTLVHAGLLPQWTVAQALALSKEVEAALRGPGHREFLRGLYGNQPDQWSDDLSGMDRLRVITNAMTRLRLCTLDGVMEFAHKGRVEQSPPGYLPWYAVPHRASEGARLIFGHWSALGLKLEGNILALDTGCLWGGCLSAVRLEDRALFQVSCAHLVNGKSF
jgi:bis(5'-nucleosyl)-tetraphosphatase (symmetrical)